MGSYEGKRDIAEINRLVDECEDPRDGYAIVQARIREYKEAGWPVPQDLVHIERNLMADLLAESQGR